jgi:serine/threonine protein kinase
MLERINNSVFSTFVHQLVHFDDPILFTMEDLLEAEAEVLGKGTYGTVYKTKLENGRILAVKRLRQDMIKDHRELKAEMAVLGKVRHSNLLGLRAYHLGSDEVFVVFDYMPKGSLHDLLHGQISGLLLFLADTSAFICAPSRIRISFTTQKRFLKSPFFSNHG